MIKVFASVMLAVFFAGSILAGTSHHWTIKEGEGSKLIKDSKGTLNGKLVGDVTWAREDDRVLLAYGYRKDDGQGVRLRVCNSELTDIETAEEMILRSDNGHPDCGYPNIAALGNNRYIIAYYMDKPTCRFNSSIEATIVNFN